MTSYRRLAAGDPAPGFALPTGASARFNFDTVAGRYNVLCFFGSAADPHAAEALSAAMARADLFDDAFASFFGVALDPADVAEKRIADRPPGRRFFRDFEGTASRLYGATPTDYSPGDGPVAVNRQWVIVDPTMRVLHVEPFARDRGDIARLFERLSALPPPELHAGFEISAPILILPNVLEPAFCDRLVALYEAHGGEESGFMQEKDGKTVGVYDAQHKVRRDCPIEDPELVRILQNRVQRRIVPEIRKVHQFGVTRMERYIVACYEAEAGGHFRAHRDNTTKGTAHRRFALSINLNDDFEGGEVVFPEYGPRGYNPPKGGAVVFSCSLLHMVRKVTKGRRFAFLPFLYDDAAAEIRQRNNAFLGEGVDRYGEASAAGKAPAEAGPAAPAP